ncbi:MAG: hypothetical protein IT282_07035 [Bacteroidetes bacterium]|nr:hypothetical protein [Bacteroidota bacterium]
MSSHRPTPEETGKLLYEHLRQEITGPGILSMNRLREIFEEQLTGLGGQFEGELIIGCMFAAVLAIEETTHPPMGQAVRRGLEGEFQRHLREQGASEAQIEEWQVVLGEHFAEYFQSVQGNADPALPAALGREFVWNLTGVEEEHAGLIEASTVYLTAARIVARRLLRQHLPVRAS